MLWQPRICVLYTYQEAQYDALAAVLAGAPEKLLATYEEERRAIAAGMLGLATQLLKESKQGRMRRGRETRQLDVGYPGTSLALQTRERDGVQAGDRAPDAPVRGAAGQRTRLFSLFRGPHWTLLGYEADRAAVAPRPGLHAVSSARAATSWTTVSTSAMPTGYHQATGCWSGRMAMSAASPGPTTYRCSSST